MNKFYSFQSLISYLRFEKTASGITEKDCVSMLALIPFHAIEISSSQVEELIFLLLENNLPKNLDLFLKIIKSRFNPADFLRSETLFLRILQLDSSILLEYFMLCSNYSLVTPGVFGANSLIPVIYPYALSHSNINTARYSIIEKELSSFPEITESQIERAIKIFQRQFTQLLPNITSEYFAFIIWFHQQYQIEDLFIRNLSGFGTKILLQHKHIEDYIKTDYCAARLFTYGCDWIHLVRDIDEIKISNPDLFY